MDNIQRLKEHIKTLSAQQKYYRNQMRTRRLVGPRELQPWKAAQKHHYNREQIRHHLYVYAELRGRNPSLGEQNSKTPINTHLRNFIKESYTTKEITV